MCAVLAGLVHVYIFFLESVAWTSPRVRRVFGIASESEAQATRTLAFNQGFYNLFLAIGAILGVVLVLAGNGATADPRRVLDREHARRRRRPGRHGSPLSQLGLRAGLAAADHTLLFAFIGSTFTAA